MKVNEQTNRNENQFLADLFYILTDLLLLVLVIATAIRTVLGVISQFDGPQGRFLPRSVCKKSKVKKREGQT